MVGMMPSSMASVAWTEKNKNNSNEGCCNDDALFLLSCLDLKINCKEVEEKEAALLGCHGICVFSACSGRKNLHGCAFLCLVTLHLALTWMMSDLSC
jgi:hypothetical protein